ncbi:SIP domain-containing protein [Aurantibacter sp.]|uniref:SIP domain-containing protein n=1 Tax=Aurantibacter sp. TaxID=2807103 RepID=UPI0032635F7F
MSLLESIIKKFVLQDAVITKKIQLTESAYSIRLQSESIKKAEFEPGYFIRLGIGIGNDDLSFKDKIRSYSVWDINKIDGYIDLAIATESKGIGAQWVENCNEGDSVYFKWKKGNFLLDATADSYLMVGDLSALSHLYILNRNLPENKQVNGIIYSSHTQDFFKDINGSNPFNFHNLPQNSTKEILKYIKATLPNMPGEKMVYIAGDSRVCVTLNQFFRHELNWNTKQIKTKPFWNPDKKGLE